MTWNQHNWPAHHLFDVRIDALSTAEVLHVAEEAIARRQRLLIGVVNAAKLVNMRKDESLRRAVLGADMILADGMSVVWACWLLRRRLPERVAGIDLMVRLLERAHEKRYRVYCLGATQEVLDTVARRIEREYPNATIVGARHGYFSDDEEAGIAEQIAVARPDILFAAMSSPKKERFLARWGLHMNVPVCHGVGGAFDVMAGKVKRAPAAWQRCGMEWLYRVVQEPGRMWRRYLVTNTAFMILLARELAMAVRRG